MMKMMLIFLLVAKSLLPLALVRAGDEVNNGSSLAKSNVIFVYQNLEKFIDVCLMLESCHLQNAEKNLLTQIKATLKLERQNTDQLKFLSGQEHPDIFFIENEFKVAVTGSNIGSPIYINLDLIAGLDKDIFLGPIDIPKAISLLIHELGHHHGEFAHDDLDILGGKVQRQAEGDIYRIDFGFFRSEESITYINYRTLMSRPELLVHLRAGILDLGNLLEQHLVCPKIISSGLNSQKPQNFQLANVHWREHGMEMEQTPIKILQGKLSMLCPDEGFAHSWVEVFFRVELPLKLVEENDESFYQLWEEPKITIL